MTTQQNTNRRENILSENPWRLMLTMSVPAIIAMSINGLNTFVDGLFVGQFVGQDALAAISLVLPLTMITNGLAAFIGVGSASLLSIAIGAEDEDTQQKVLGTLTIISAIISVLLTGFGWYFANDLLAMMGGSGDIQEIGVRYYRVILLGSFFRIYAVAANMLIRAEGKIKEAMWYSIIAALINIILNPIFIIYFKMDVEGAAWATVVAMFVFTLLDIWYFYISKRTSYTVSITRFSLEKKLLKPIFSVGLSAMMLQFMFFVQQVIVFRSLAHYGNDWDITFMGACYRIFMLVIMPGYGFAQALQPLIGINYGARDYSRVKELFRVFFISYTVLLVLLWAVILVFPEMTLRWMIPDADFASQDIWNYIIMMSTIPLMPSFLLAATLFQGIGEGKAAGFVLVAREILMYIPIVLILPLWFGIPGIYAALVPVNILTLILCYWLVKKKFQEWNAA